MRIQLSQLIAGTATLLIGATSQAQLYSAGPWTLSIPAPALYQLDTDTAQATEIGTSGTYFAASGMTYDGERMLVVTQTDVYTINQTTGSPSLLHHFGDQFRLIEGAVAADPETQTLYFANRTTFATMDLDTGNTNVLFENGSGLDLSGMTFDDQGRLWAVYLNGPLSRIAQIDPTTGLRLTYDLVSLPSAVPSVGGLAYDSDNSVMYAISGSTLVDITDRNNPITIGSTGVPSMSGLVYVPQGTTCPPDLTNDGVLDFFDISAFLNAFSAEDPIADFSNDGTYDFFDISAFLAGFSAGCP